MNDANTNVEVKTNPPNPKLGFEMPLFAMPGILEVTSAQNKELWELAQKVATETAEPIKKSFTRVLQKAP